MAVGKSYMFKQAATFGVGVGQQFSRGHHHVPSEIEKHHYFQKLLKAKLVVPADESKGEDKKPMSLVEQQRFAVEQQKEALKGSKEVNENEDHFKDEDEEVPKESKGKKGK